ncbi:MAG: phosphoglycerate kinase [Deltaproteobacteria bacterium]
MKSIEDLDLAGRRVFVRVDYNVHIKDGRVTDATRIEESLPTLRLALGRGARLVLASHLGRPGGKVAAELSLAPVAAELARLLDTDVSLAEDCVGSEVRRAAEDLADGGVLLLENLRFHAGEEADDGDFAAALAELADVYINDAFGAAHRAHASTHALAALFEERGAGLLILEEVRQLDRLLGSPDQPFVAVVGGAKVSDKLELLESLAQRANTVLVGGAMAYTFLAAQGHEVGSSRVETDKVDTARTLLESAAADGTIIELPSDHIAAESFASESESVEVSGQSIPDGLMGLDIGPATQTRYADILRRAGTILWNGPMGVFEWENFRAGTMAVAAAVADSAASSVVGGGDSLAALALSGRKDDVSHVSTGGGASLEFLAGHELPGLSAIGYQAR